MIYRYGLFRDPAQGWVAGVAAGLGQRFGVSDGAIRLAFVLLALMGTPILALVGYTVLVVLLPIRPALLEPRAGREWRHR